MNRGFTLIEVLVVVSIVSILAVIIGSVVGSGTTVRELMSGVVCKAGYKFSVDTNGNQMQIFDENGRAIPCGGVR